MSWKVRAAQALGRNLREALPETALVAVATADEDGYSVELSDGCHSDGRFEIGSITKTMTGAVLASLADDGIVGIGDEIGRWLDAGRNADITLRQLATHTSGLPRLSPSHVLGAPDPYEFLTAAVAEEELRRTPPRPREAEHDYSNFGFQLLGVVLERADGAPIRAAAPADGVRPPRHVLYRRARARLRRNQDHGHLPGCAGQTLEWLPLGSRRCRGKRRGHGALPVRVPVPTGLRGRSCDPGSPATALRDRPAPVGGAGVGARPARLSWPRRRNVRLPLHARDQAHDAASRSGVCQRAGRPRPGAGCPDLARRRIGER